MKRDLTKCTIVERRYLESTARLKRISKVLRRVLKKTKKACVVDVSKKLDRAMAAQRRALDAFCEERGL